MPSSLSAFLTSRDLVVAVEDDEVPDGTPMRGPQRRNRPSAKRWKVPTKVGSGVDAEQALDTLGHLAGRLVGEGDGNHRVGRHRPTSRTSQATR